MTFDSVFFFCNDSNGIEFLSTWNSFWNIYSIFKEISQRLKRISSFLEEFRWFLKGFCY